MAKDKTIYTCEQCGANNSKWQGQCPGCGAWNTLIESRAAPATSRFEALAAGGGVQVLAQVEAKETTRISTEQEELDRVLGGGIVPRYRRGLHRRSTIRRP